MEIEADGSRVGCLGTRLDRLTNPIPTPIYPPTEQAAASASAGEGITGIEEGAERVERAVALLSQKLDLPRYDESNLEKGEDYGGISFPLICLSTHHSKKRRLASLTEVLEDEKSWQGQGQERMMALVKEAAQLKGQVRIV